MSHTFLQIVQRLAERVGASGSGARPTTTVGQTGEMLRLVNYVVDAWVDIQETHEDWDFMRSSFSFTTTAQQATYTPAQAGITDFGNWKRDSVRIYTTSSAFGDEQLAGYMDYDTWRNLYQYANMRTTYSRPVLITITPAKALGLGPTPDSTGYTVVGEYFKLPAELTADTDVPTLPDKWWRMIFYRAMMFYGSFESAPEVFAEGEREYKLIVSRMQADQLTISFGNALA